MTPVIVPEIAPPLETLYILKATLGSSDPMASTDARVIETIPLASGVVEDNITILNISHDGVLTFQVIVLLHMHGNLLLRTCKEIPQLVSVPEYVMF